MPSYMSLISIVFETSPEFDEIRSNLIKAKLDLTDRIVLAMNFGSFWKDASRYFPDFTMRALFFETFDNAWPNCWSSISASRRFT